MKKSSNSMIDGVCAGIAEKIDCDPIWVRLVFMFANLAPLYIALMFLMDEPDENKQNSN